MKRTVFLLRDPNRPGRHLVGAAPDGAPPGTIVTHVIRWRNLRKAVEEDAWLELTRMSFADYCQRIGV